MEHVFAVLGIKPNVNSIGSVWEPACGEGHISGVLEEYTGPVFATDVFDYSSGSPGKSPPGWLRVHDFFHASADIPAVNWIITNPPFESATLFVIRALEIACEEAVREEHTAFGKVAGAAGCVPVDENSEQYYAWMKARGPDGMPPVDVIRSTNGKERRVIWFPTLYPWPTNDERG